MSNRFQPAKEGKKIAINYAIPVLFAFCKMINVDEKSLSLEIEKSCSNLLRERSEDTNWNLGGL